MKILFPEDTDQLRIYEYWINGYSGLCENIWTKIGIIMITSLCWNGYLFSKDQYKNFAEQNKYAQHYSKIQQQREALHVREQLAWFHLISFLKLFAIFRIASR